MKPIVTDDFLENLARYGHDHMFERCLTEVRKEFLDMSGRHSLSGENYMVLCILVAQAMDNMLAGYGGRTNAAFLLYEAVGFSAAHVISVEDRPTFKRYQGLYAKVAELQITNKPFADTLNRVLALDIP